MKILLVVPRQTRMKSYHLPVGVGYVSASLKQAGHEVVVLNPNHSVEELSILIEEEISRNVPQVVAVGGMAFHLGEIKQVATLARALLPHAFVIVGGTLVSNQPLVAMKAVPEADFGIIGEGEYTSVELMSALETGTDLEMIKGLIYRFPETGALKQTTPRSIEQNLDALPWVDYEGLGLDIYAGLHRPGECAPALILDSETRVMPLLTSRGCPFPCTFCCHEAAGRRYRVRNLDDVFAEITAAIERFHINALFIYDDLFCLKRERLLEFCRRVKPLGLRWECSLRVEQIEADVLQLMRDSGCCCISVGVESMSPPVLESMKKKTTRETLERALSMIYDARIGLWSNLIFGDPAETVDTMRESLEWFCNNSRYNLRFANIGYHPGSRIYDDAVKQGLIGDPTTFLLEESPEINATVMSDLEVNTMRALGEWALVSFGHAGRLVDLKQEDGRMVAKCICPYCGVVGHCKTLDSRSGMLPNINCPICNRAYRVPVCVRTVPALEISRHLETLQQLETMRCDNVIVAICKKVIPSRLGELFWRPQNEKIDAICRVILALDATNNDALHALIRLADVAGDGQRAIGLMQKVIQNDPYNVALFEQMAERLARIGEEGPREKYVRKAAHLRSAGITGTGFIYVPPMQHNLEQPLPASDQAILGELGSQLFY